MTGSALDNRADERATGHPIPVGTIDLIEPVFQSRKAELWLGHDRKHARPVAVKVFTPQAVEHISWRSAFMNEIEVLGSLRHPHIIRALGSDTVSSLTERHSDGRLRRGAPYLVLERANGGSLQPYCGWLSWSEVHIVLLQLLDALAYIHSRGFLHRDLKPGNVLVLGHEPDEGIKLADFELAKRRSTLPLSAMRIAEHPVGTPAYMAPEQLLGHTWTYGPWTDLYQLGCLACSLLTGEPPYGDNPEQAAAGHLGRDPYEFRPRVQVPSGLDGWLARLLYRAPSQRFQRASDAALALQGIARSPYGQTWGNSGEATPKEIWSVPGLSWAF